MLRPWLADAQINRDRNLRLQFLAGASLNMYDQAGIYSQMLQYRRYPGRTVHRHAGRRWRRSGHRSADCDSSGHPERSEGSAGELQIPRFARDDESWARALTR